MCSSDRQPESRRQPSCSEIVLRWNSERVGHAVEEGKHRSDVDRFGNLVFTPTGVAQLLYVFGCRTISGLGDQFHVVEQHPLRRSETRLLELALNNRVDALISSSLNTQEVSVAVQSIRTTVQVRDVAGDHLLVAAREMAFREMDGVGEIDDLAEEVGARSEALDDAWDLFAAGLIAPGLIGGSGVAGGGFIGPDADLGFVWLIGHSR